MDISKIETEEQYVNYLESLISIDNKKENETIYERYFEWEIDDWDKIKDENYVSQFFGVGGYIWKISLYPNGNGNEGRDYVSAYLTNVDVIKNDTVKIWTRFIFSIRNHNDYSSFYFKTSSMNYFSKSHNGIGFPQYIKKENLLVPNGSLNKPLLEDNKIVIGALVQVYMNDDEENSLMEMPKEKNDFFNNLQNLITQDILNVDDIVGDGYYEWELNDLSQIDKKEFSPLFVIYNYILRIVIDTNTKHEKLKDYLSVHLVNMDSYLNKKAEPPSISVELVLFIRNHKSYDYYIAKSSSSEDYSNRNNMFHGFTKFIEKRQLYIRDEKTGLSLVENDKLVVGAYVRVYNKSRPMVCRKISVRKGHSTYSQSDECSVYVSRSLLVNSNKNLFSLSNNVAASRKDISPVIHIETFYTENKWNKIHMACRNGDIIELNILIDRGEDITELTGDGWSALHIACQYGFLNIVKVLLEMGIGINLVNNGWSAIEIACNNGHYQVVDYLMDKGADLHLDTNDEYKLLHLALNTKENKKKMMDLVLRKGHIDVNAKDYSGWTALHIVSRDNCYELAKYLIETANAKVNEEDRNLNTPLHIASQYGNFAIVQLLLNNHANINFKNLNGWTALHIACQYDNKNVIQLLMDNKADINSTTFDEWNALHIAVYYNNTTIVKYLLKKKPDLTEKNVDDMTVIDMARMIRNPQIIKLLNDHIATLDSKLSKTLYNQLNNAIEEDEEEKKEDEEEEEEDGEKKKERGIMDYRNEIINKSEVLINEIKNKNFINAINIIESNEIQLENIDKNGWTAFHWASYMGSTEVVTKLIERNVKIDRKTLSGIDQSNELKGKTAKELANIRGHKSVVNIIKIEIYKRTFNIALEGITKVAEFIPK